MFMQCMNEREHDCIFLGAYIKELKIWTGTETFAKEPKLEKIISGDKADAYAMPYRKFTGLFSYVCNAEFEFWRFAAVQYVNGWLFADIDVFFIGLRRSLKQYSRLVIACIVKNATGI